MHRLVVFECFLLVTCVVASDVISRDVEIDSGVVRGYKAVDGDYFAYLGISYAAPPVGNRRFKAPLPPPSWNGVFHANRTVICPQLGKGNEDCLIVNVFTPTKIINGPLPVLVYIHGGSFLLVSGQTKGVSPLIKQNVIVVTLNYRLGALGFLCLGIDEAPGNAGLKDQVAALKWVQRNINQFGGDPNEVTIYGMSAGGASVDLQVLSKMSERLFHNVIIESGTATTVWSVDANPIQTAFDFAKAFGFDKKNLYMLADFFRQWPVHKLSVANNEYYQNLTDGTFGFVPCVEKKLYGVVPFLTTSPHRVIKKKGYNKVPKMFIFANAEGLYLRSSDYYELDYKNKMERNFKDFMPADLIFDTEEIKDQVTGNVRYFYFRNKTIGDNTLMEYLDYFGDSLVLHGLLNSAEAYACDNDVYMMEFAYKGSLGSRDEIFEKFGEAGHGDAIKHAILNKPIRNEDDKIAVERMSKIVTNFMRYSNPIPLRTELLPIHWPVMDPDNVMYLHLGKDLQVFEDPYWERKTFWDRLYEGHRREIKPVDTGML